jgi:hypothetical protein
MIRLMPHDQALIVPHSSAFGRFSPAASVRPMTPSVNASARSG